MPEDTRPSRRYPVVDEVPVVREDFQSLPLVTHVGYRGLNPKGQVSSTYRETGEPVSLVPEPGQIAYNPEVPKMAIVHPHGHNMPPNRMTERSRMSLGHRMLRAKGSRYDQWPGVADTAGRRYGVPGIPYPQPGWEGQGGVAQRPLCAYRKLPNAYKAEQGFYQDTYGIWRQVQGRTLPEAMERSNFQGIGFGGTRRYGMTRVGVGLTTGDVRCHAADLSGGLRGCQVRVGAIDCYFNSEGQVWCAWAADVIHGKIKLPKKAKQLLAQAKPGKNKHFSFDIKQAQKLVNEIRSRVFTEGGRHKGF